MASWLLKKYCLKDTNTVQLIFSALILSHLQPHTISLYSIFFSGLQEITSLPVKALYVYLIFERAEMKHKGLSMKYLFHCRTFTNNNFSRRNQRLQELHLVFSANSLAPI